MTMDMDMNVMAWRISVLFRGLELFKRISTIVGFDQRAGMVMSN